jgi:hypothetical protein
MTTPSHGLVLGPVANPKRVRLPAETDREDERDHADDEAERTDQP